MCAYISLYAARRAYPRPTLAEIAVSRVIVAVVNSSLRFGIFSLCNLKRRVLR